MKPPRLSSRCAASIQSTTTDMGTIMGTGTMTIVMETASAMRTAACRGTRITDTTMPEAAGQARPKLHALPPESVTGGRQVLTAGGDGNELSLSP